MDSRPSASQQEKILRRKRFLAISLFRSLVCYTVCSLLEAGLMSWRVEDGTLFSPLAKDFVLKLVVLLLSCLIFGFSFIVFRPKALPSAAKRFLHILLVFVPVVLVSQSLAVDANLDMQDYVAFYFFASLLYLAIYGVCMLISSIIRRKRAVQK